MAALVVNLMHYLHLNKLYLWVIVRAIALCFLASLCSVIVSFYLCVARSLSAL